MHSLASDDKTLHSLEFPQVLARLAEYTQFSAGHELALMLEPSPDTETVVRRQAETREARWLLSAHPSARIGGIRDVRPAVENARLAAVLAPQALLDIRYTLEAAGQLQRVLLRVRHDCPHLAGVAAGIAPSQTVIDEIARCLDDQGAVLDHASPKLAEIRTQLPRSRERLRAKLEHVIRAPQNAPYLQEPLITQRAGRYVIPLKAEHKGRIRGIVHDQSASGATLFIEPLAVLELNNACRQLEMAEQREIERILRSLSSLVAGFGDEIIWTVEAMANLDVAFAKAEYAETLHAVSPEIVEPSCFDLRQARHPLLDPESVVPIDVRAGDDFSILVITGPNTGGKTVTLKTVGLLSLMTQAGLQIPAAEGSRQALFSRIYADIGDEQSIEQSLSTFSGHMRNIVRILAHADERSLVLLDELGAGTDPVEGAALARALLNHLLQKKITCLVATHYSELKAFAQVTPGVVNASLEFDLETLSPTYRLTIGLPGRSNALAIAERLGLDQEILAAARQTIAPENMEVDEMVSAIQEAKDEATEVWQRAALAREQAEALEREWQTRMAAIEAERAEILNRARQQAQEELDEALRKIRSLRRQAEALGRPLPELQQVREAAKELEKEVQSHPAPVSPLPTHFVSLPGPLQTGDTVFVASLNRSAEVVTIGDGEVEVLAGSFRLRVPAGEVTRQGKAGSRARTESSKPAQMTRVSPGVELDLRGSTVEEALPLLDKYLDDAFLADLPAVRIIHGKGTGVLRKATREKLSSHPLVVDFRPGDRHEGGDGVTVVVLDTTTEE
ncbi:MAG: endonuclease MutS2 [Chloroflexi bacterium]|nr:endonuclease MutS2 [Chloroflexota bacterium]